MELLSCAFKIHVSIVKTAGHMYKKGTKKIPKCVKEFLN